MDRESSTFVSNKKSHYGQLVHGFLFTLHQTIQYLLKKKTTAFRKLQSILYEMLKQLNHNKRQALLVSFNP